MTKPLIHPNWLKSPERLTDGYSLEITAKDVAALREAAGAIAPDTPIAVTFLPGEAFEARVAAARAVRELGFEPMPHFSARRITAADELADYLDAVVREAGVRRCFIVAGDPPQPEGPYAESMDLIGSGLFERAGVTAIGIGGHPEGHPHMTTEQAWAVLATKCAAIEARGMAPLIVTQFSFDPDAVLAWLRELRERGIHDPVRLGVPGPAGIKTLLRFAKHCGVGASAAVLAKYGISLAHLLGTAGPDRLVEALAKGIGPEHGPVRLHFYPFGGVARTVDWIDGHARRG